MPLALKLVNLEQDHPTVDNGLLRLDRALASARQERITLLKLIHGYGSSGVGGQLRTEVWKVLDRYKRAGTIREFIPGEQFRVSDEAAWALTSYLVANAIILPLSGWLTELFVETPWSFHYFVNLETRARRSPLLQMCAHGAILLSLDGAAERYQNESRHMLAKGPPPITKDELDQRRYELTNLLDDFIGSISSEELTYVTGQLLTKSSELALLSGSQWLGAGKWLARRLQQFNPDLLIRLDGAVRSVVQDNDRAPMQSTVREVLDTVGGPLSEGYRNVAKPAHKPTKFNEPARPSDVSEVDRRRSAPTADAS